MLGQNLYDFSVYGTPSFSICYRKSYICWVPSSLCPPYLLITEENTKIAEKEIRLKHIKNFGEKENKVLELGLRREYEGLACEFPKQNKEEQKGQRWVMTFILINVLCGLPAKNRILF